MILNNGLMNGLPGRHRLWALALLASTASGWAQESPVEVIQSASDQLASELNERRDELMNDSEALYALVDDIILPRFDRRYAAQLVLGQHWKTASEQQREDFVDALYNNLVQKYADAILEFNQDQIDLQPFRGDTSKRRVVVKSIVTTEDGTKVPVDYGLVQRDDGWMVFDVVVEGISYVRNFRAEVDSEIDSSSLDAVIARLESETPEDGEQPAADSE